MASTVKMAKTVVYGKKVIDLLNKTKTSARASSPFSKRIGPVKITAINF